MTDTRISKLDYVRVRQAIQSSPVAAFKNMPRSDNLSSQRIGQFIKTSPFRTVKFEPEPNVKRVKSGVKVMKSFARNSPSDAGNSLSTTDKSSITVRLH